MIKITTYTLHHKHDQTSVHVSLCRPMEEDTSRCTDLPRRVSLLRYLMKIFHYVSYT